MSEPLWFGDNDDEIRAAHQLRKGNAMRPHEHPVDSRIEPLKLELAQARKQIEELRVDLFAREEWICQKTKEVGGLEQQLAAAQLTLLKLRVVRSWGDVDEILGAQPTAALRAFVLDLLPAKVGHCNDNDEVFARKDGFNAALEQVLANLEKACGQP